ncbi:ATPase [Paenibacillus thiaminolyticus]|uniref:ATPase n=1 Tax=Paenibacillus thiaminolyticus TaxID=49283 RepID=UPI003D2E837F
MRCAVLGAREGGLDLAWRLRKLGHDVWLVLPEAEEAERWRHVCADRMLCTVHADYAVRRADAVIMPGSWPGGAALADAMRLAIVAAPAPAPGSTERLRRSGEAGTATDVAYLPPAWLQATGTVLLGTADGQPLAALMELFAPMKRPVRYVPYRVAEYAQRWAARGGVPLWRERPAEPAEEQARRLWRSCCRPELDRVERLRYPSWPKPMPGELSPLDVTGPVRRNVPGENAATRGIQE